MCFVQMSAVQREDRSESVSVCSPVDGAPSSGILFWVDNSAALILLPALKISFHQSGAQGGDPEKQCFQCR